MKKGILCLLAVVVVGLTSVAQVDAAKTYSATGFWDEETAETVK